MENNLEKSISKSQRKANRKNSFGGRVWSNITSQMGAIVICVIFAISLASFFNNAFGQVVLLIVNSIIYYTAIYACMWEIGHRDSNRIRFGHEELDKYRGVKIGLVANIPVWFMWAVLFAGKLGAFDFNEVVSGSVVVVYKLLNPQVWPLLNMMSNTVDFNDITIMSLIILLLSVSIMPLISQLFYILGIKDIAPLQKLIYKNDKKKKK